ncbi:hypothetical protein CPB84DRAFT_622463 [Gymnopilus junonius]|uniref:Uncharacterized protein n=1 Tax=Gymnopilus junonius TaxID=109634 RepID=A0A9P5N808_GYMJU|nr:hypothetical protein CPB84DRAFT_622463 [Gymnopilus junonius]
MRIANEQISKMQTVLNGPNPKSHPAVVAAFGTNVNIFEIKSGVAKLQTETFFVDSADARPDVTQGATNDRDKHVLFGSSYFAGNDDKMRAGTVIHELAHTINKDVDHFKTDGSPYDFGAKPDTKNFLVGYSHMKDLKALRSDQMHKNTDSYCVFGEEDAKLARWALEEEDLDDQSSCVALTKRVPITLRIRLPLNR